MKRLLTYLKSRWAIVMLVVIPACVAWALFWILAGPNLIKTIRNALP
ncbi:MAG: hypothetical protein WD648_05720 [Planctomycetaceae bacterium]